MSSVITFNGRACIDTRDLRRECDDRGIPINEWWGRANGFKCPLELGRPGVGYLLLYEEDLPADLYDNYTLRFDDGKNPAVEFTRLFVKRWKCVVPGGDGDTRAVLMVEVCDGRGNHPYHTGTPGYGAPPIPSDGGRDGYTAMTWTTLFNDVVSTSIVASGTGTLSLPFAPDGNPELFDYRGWSRPNMADHLLTRLACAYKLNPVTNVRSIVRLGATDSTADAALATIAARAPKLWEFQPSGDQELPNGVAAVFARSPMSSTLGPGAVEQAGGYTPPSSASSWNGSVRLWDDLLWNDSNLTARQNRATERVTDYVRVKTYFEVTAGKVFEGWHKEMADVLGSRWGEVAWFDYGDGPRTSCRNEPGKRLESWRPAGEFPEPPDAAWSTVYISGSSSIGRSADPSGTLGEISVIASTLSHANLSDMTRISGVVSPPLHLGTAALFSGFFILKMKAGTYDATLCYALLECDATGTAINNVTPIWNARRYVAAGLSEVLNETFQAAVPAQGSQKYYALFALGQTNPTVSGTVAGAFNCGFTASPYVSRAVTVASPTLATSGTIPARTAYQPKFGGSPAPLAGAVAVHDGTNWRAVNPPTVDGLYYLSLQVVAGLVAVGPDWKIQPGPTTYSRIFDDAVGDTHTVTIVNGFIDDWTVI